MKSTLSLIPAFRQLVQANPNLNIIEYLYLLASLPGSKWTNDEERQKARTELNRELLPNGCLKDVWHMIQWPESDKVPGQPLGKSPEWAKKTIEEGRIKKTEVEPPQEAEIVIEVAADLETLRDYAIENCIGTKFAKLMRQAATAVAEGQFDPRVILNVLGLLSAAYGAEQRAHAPLVKVDELYERHINTINEKHALEVRLLTSDTSPASSSPIYNHSDFKRQ
jgi:hypothetical protein